MLKFLNFVQVFLYISLARVVKLLTLLSVGRTRFEPFEKLIRGVMSEAGLIDEDRLDIVLLTDDPKTGVDWITSHVDNH